MATKKRKVKRPTLANDFINDVTTAAEASTTMYSVYAEKTKALNLDLDKSEGVPQPTWRDVAVLLQGQADLLRKLSELLNWFEDPAVAHVIEMKKSIDEMKRQLNDLRCEFESHERNYDHTRTDPYY